MTFDNQNRGILIISFHFPPSTKVGGKRFAALTQLLINRYPNLHILTVKKKHISPSDDTIPYKGTVHRAGMFPSPPISKTDNNLIKRVWRRLWEDYLCILDLYAGWILPAVFKGLKVIRQNDIKLVIATGPPFSPMLVGFLLKILCRTKLILDYRDPWSNHDARPILPFYKTLNRLCERLVVRQSSALVFCSRIMLENFSKSVARNVESFYYVIHNGFHGRDTVQPLSFEGSYKTMIYAGKFYGERKIELLAKPLFRLVKEDLINENSFRFHVFGQISDRDKKIIRKYNLQHMIVEHLPVPYGQIVRYLKGADILFLPSGSEVNYAIPFKFYDYLSVKKPIFAVAHEDSAVAELMKTIDCGCVAKIGSEESIVTNLRKIISENRQYSFSGANQFTWNEIACKYSAVIDNLWRK
jgi:glycosyltransferase involved in cell wall biosynthesis